MIVLAHAAHWVSGLVLVVPVVVIGVLLLAGERCKKRRRVRA
jgi:hypothetical protein